MRPIILASASKARRNILKQAGLKFKTQISRVCEIKNYRLGIAATVTANALAKARDVAAEYKHGIVIGADTVVECNRSIIGKPKTINEAVDTLKLLSRKPQWVYSGIAVVDIDRGKEYTDYEKTKVYICSLTEKQIRGYFKQVSPLEKAGSYDIQGPGGLFVERIEGCYTNVVGLPLAKLGKILIKLNVDLLDKTGGTE